MNSKHLINVAIIFALLFAGCKKEKDDPNILTDIDGNQYNVITIGSQTWMKENLRVTRFRDGSQIAYIMDAAAWTSSTSPAYCWCENNSDNKNSFGGLYNGYAVRDSRGLCPTGWHVATDSDWKNLETTAGMMPSDLNTVGDRGETENVGGHLKSITTWDSPNLGADNKTGFTALGTGYRRPPGEFSWFKQWTGFYTSTTSSDNNLWMRYLGYDMKAIARVERSLNYGYSIRCVKD